MKGSTNIILSVAAIFIGIFALIVIYNTITGTASGQAEALETATRLSFHINSMSSVERGKVTMDLGRKFDISIVNKDSIFRDIGRALLPESLEDWVDQNGYYVVATPYTKELDLEANRYRKIRGDSAASFILAYKESGMPEIKYEGVERVCIEKRPESVAELVGC